MGLLDSCFRWLLLVVYCAWFWWVCVVGVVSDGLGVFCCVVLLDGCWVCGLWICWFVCGLLCGFRAFGGCLRIACLLR